jgi:Xaa-Pro aminopeptidase
MPSLSTRSTDVLEPGHIVTVEPGVYLPGFGGVRIEDLVAVEEGGHRLLSHSRRDLIEIA